MNSESDNPPREIQALQSSRAIADAGLPSEAADEIVKAITEALADVVKNDDLKHALDSLESDIKSYADKLSKDDREYLGKVIDDAVDKLRKDLSGRLGKANDRIDDVIAQIKKLSEALAAVERRAQERETAAERRGDDKRDESDRLNREAIKDAVREMRLTVIWVVAVATALNVLANLFT